MDYMIMFNLIRNITVTAAVLAVGGVAWAGDPGSYQQWRFESQANPASPEVNTAGGIGGSASVTPGRFASGWRPVLPGFNGQTGFWDLGRTGTISIANADLGAVERTLRVTVCQWQDGGVFSELANVVVAGGTRTATSQQTVCSTALGSWVSSESQWTVPAGVSGESILITSAFDGSVIESVAVENSAGAGTSVALAIRRSGSQVQLVWPVSAQGYALESTTNVADPSSWHPVDGQPSVEGDNNVVTTEAGETVRLFRLRRP